jgi:hypothetical protein
MSRSIKFAMCVDCEYAYKLVDEILFVVRNYKIFRRAESLTLCNSMVDKLNKKKPNVDLQIISFSKNNNEP